MSRPYARVLRRFENGRTTATADGDATVTEELDFETDSLVSDRAGGQEPAGLESTTRRRRRRRRTAGPSDSRSERGAVGHSLPAPGGVTLRDSGGPSLLVPRGPNQAQLTRSGLLDVLRTVAPRHACPCVVIVGVSGAEDLSTLLLGLARQAEANGLGFLHAQVTSGPRGRSLNVLDNTSESADERYAIGTLEHWNQEGDGRPSRGREFDRWLENASLHHDLILVEGPSLDQSLEAALLGSHCDGLLLAAEVDRTHRAALSLASERATASGCHVLGIVLTETKRWLPRWMERLLDELLS